MQQRYRLREKGGEIAYNDGAECIAETGVLIERGERSEIPAEALKLFERFIR